MPAFVDDEVGIVDEKKSPLRRESVSQEREIKDYPGPQRRLRYRLPGLVEPQLIEKGL
jgi:hypothetical protein